MDVAVAHIEKLDLGLEVLSYVAHDEESIEEYYPTWVPRWDLNITSTFFESQKAYYAASADLPPSSFTLLRRYPHHPVSRLKLKARYLGRIQFDLDLTTSHLPLSLIPFVIWEGGELKSRSQKKGGQLTPINIAPTPTAGLSTSNDLKIYPADEDPTEHYKRFRALMRRVKDVSYHKAKVSTGEQCDDSDIDDETEANYFDLDLRRAASDRTFFVTVDGRLGLGPRIWRAGDEVWLPMGARMPFTLRNEDTKTYRILGQTYLHGVMRGEAVKELTEEDFEVITLC